MQLIRTTKDTKEYRLIKQLYKQAFPRNERAPFFLLMRKSKRPEADFWALYDADKWVGLAYIVRYRDLVYIFYLAIRAKERGRGYGAKAMEALREQYRGCRIFLALETLDKTADNYAQRLKRHSFYERCGLSDMPYQLKEASMVYDIMGIGDPVEPEEYRAMMEKYIGKFLVRAIDMRIVK